MLQQFPVIVGPTAGGKSAVALALARALPGAGLGPGELVTADSMQVYRGMDIGTAKPAPGERHGVAHHLIDLVEPTESFSVDQWLEQAEACIAGIRSRGATPIVVGGTNLYVKALLEGLFEGPPADAQLRRELAALEPGERHRALEAVDPEAARRIHPNDARRTIRALEVHRLAGQSISRLQSQWDRGRARPDALLVGLEWPTDEINRRINSRVRRMLERGLLEEVRGLWSRGVMGPQAREALGYKQLLEHLDGTTTLDRAVERIKVETRRFAKNQRTWLRRLRATPGALWIEAAGLTEGEFTQVSVNSILTRLSRR